jgi:hypothetical protein
MRQTAEVDNYCKLKAEFSKLIGKRLTVRKCVPIETRTRESWTKEELTPCRPSIVHKSCRF